MNDFLSGYIDHTKLGPQVTIEDIKKLIDEAKTYNFRGVCLPSSYLLEAKNLIGNSPIILSTTLSFPFGQDATAIKIYESQYFIDNGADEIDMVINIGRFKNKEYDYVKNEIDQIKKIMKSKKLKVIIETALLTSDEIVKATSLILDTDADYIKTSTGYAGKGASLEDIKLIKSIIGDKSLKIKASGGIKTKEFCLDLIENGALIIGTSNGVSIIKEQNSQDSY
jgi:deoxyribose-phosphate aldolase